MMSPPEEEPEQSHASKLRRAVRWFALYWLLLVTLTHWPNPWPPSGEPHYFDKVAHFTLYGTLALLALHALTLRSPNASAVVRRVGIFASVTAFGLFDEATQPIPIFNRDFEWLDWLADGLGAATGIALYEWLRQRWR